ncbi:MAG TPA: hypothetical protein VFF53_07545 [Geobacteraceae bacterium]|nr:hypothetical protein [Geobacteraceae bacterium]
MKWKLRSGGWRRRSGLLDHPEWDNACAICGCHLDDPAIVRCERCG